MKTWINFGIFSDWSALCWLDGGCFGGFFFKEENNQLQSPTELLSRRSNQLTFRVAIGFLIIGRERGLID